VAKQRADEQSAGEEQNVKRSTVKVVALVALLYVPVAAVISLVIMPFYRNNVAP
jgi:hypothetical protein